MGEVSGCAADTGEQIGDIAQALGQGDSGAGSITSLAVGVASSTLVSGPYGSLVTPALSLAFPNTFGEGEDPTAALMVKSRTSQLRHTHARKRFRSRSIGTHAGGIEKLEEQVSYLDDRTTCLDGA